MSSSKKRPSNSKTKKSAKKAPAPKRAAADHDIVDASKLGEPLSTMLRSLPVVLTPAEYDERGHEAGVLSAQIKALEADKRAKNEALNAEIKKANARLDQVHAQLNTRTEDREVEVSTFADFETGVKLTVRMDTFKIIGKDKMSPAEKRGDTPPTPPVPPVVESKPETGKRGRKVKGKPKDDEAGETPSDGDEKPAEDAPAEDAEDKGSDEGDDASDRDDE